MIKTLLTYIKYLFKFMYAVIYRIVRAISSFISLFMSYVRIIWLYFNAFLYVFFHIIPIRRRYKNPTKYSIEEKFKHLRGLYNVIVKHSGLKVIVEGREHTSDEAVLYVANHPSMIDPYFLSYAADKQLGAVIAGDLWFDRIPILAPWFLSFGCVFLNRKNPRESIKGFNLAVENLKKGHSLMLFPEGEITRFISSESVGTFQTGGIKMALKGKVPIVPMAIIGTDKVYEAHEVIGPLKKGVIMVKILPQYTKHLDQEMTSLQVAEEVQQLIKNTVDQTVLPSLK